MQKDAMEQAIALITCSWDVFEALWEARNKILHGDENVLRDIELNECTEKLLEYRHLRFEHLRRGDHFIINHPVSEVIKWERTKKQATLATLEKLHRIYQMELQREADRLQPITRFFQPLTAEETSE